MIDAAVPIIKSIEKMREVTKVSLGMIKNVGTGQRKLKFKPINGGICVFVRGSTCVQEVFIYTEIPSETQRKIESIFYE
jgi:hypothetical protein